MEDIEYKVILAFLKDSWSHRKIQKEILDMPAPARGGGFEAMKILHKFGIGGEQKGRLKGQNLTKAELMNWLNNDNVNISTYIPKKADIEKAIEQVARGKNGASLGDILDMVGVNCREEGKTLKPNWRLITERNIEIWF